MTFTTVMSWGALRKSKVMAEGTCSYVSAVGIIGSRRWMTTSPLVPFRGRHSPGTGPPGVRINCEYQHICQDPVSLTRNHPHWLLSNSYTHGALEATAVHSTSVV